MRTIRGDWKDLPRGFTIALDPRKMFLGFAGIVFTVFGPVLVTCWLGNRIDPDHVMPPASLAPGDIWETLCSAWHAIYNGGTGGARWEYYVPYSILFVPAVIAIWAYFGGAIARIAAWEIARDGERMEASRALQFTGKRFGSFFMAPIFCVLLTLGFALCNAAVGLLGRLIEMIPFVGPAGAPLISLFLGLAFLSGLIMVMTMLLSAAGLPLFTSAFAVEANDALESVSRCWSYVYHRPLRYLVYQGFSAVHGVVCVFFVLMLGVLVCHVGLKAGIAGFDVLGTHTAPELPPMGDIPTSHEKRLIAEYREDFQLHPEKYARHYDRFQDIADSAWAILLSRKYQGSTYGWTPSDLASRPDPYGRFMHLADALVRPDYDTTIEDLEGGGRQVAGWIVRIWLVLVLGMALGYLPSYVVSQQTLVYCLLRKSLDGIDIDEIFDDGDPGAGHKSHTPSPSGPPVEPPK